GFQAEAWLVSLSGFLKICSCSSNTKGHVVIHLLRDGASVWWRKEEQKLHVDYEIVTWELFEEHFQCRYLSKRFIHQRKDEFHDLRQGSLSVAEYE
ncbi:hypothetical protein KI387_034115, partial [Taxus chinensis]